MIAHRSNLPTGCRAKFKKTQVIQALECPAVETWQYQTAKGVYKIIDRETDRFYIGSAASLRKRWNNHTYRMRKGTHPNSILQSIWNKSPERLKFHVLNEMPGATKEVRLSAEQLLLDEAEVGKNKACMNFLAIAGSHEGAKRSDETKARLSRALKGKPISKEARIKMRAAKIGRPLSAEHRRKIGEKSRGKPGPVFSDEQLRKFRKYSEFEVASLRQQVADGIPRTVAARKIGISNTVAARIISGKSYVGVGQS